MRGSTCRCGARRARTAGSPAHAGIDLRRTWFRTDDGRLPRACGDRPWCAQGPGHEWRAPPRMRGSTCDRLHPAVQGGGSPAHAGIDRLSRAWNQGRQGLPRACGDRPHHQPAAGDACRAPPRMRGSTRKISDDEVALRGSPAHAGIDPPFFSLLAASRWLPRACGDRPSASASLALLTAAPPRMRGSTRSRRRTADPDRGSPAHAGIDLTM